MFQPLFFSQNTIMFEKVLLFPKIPQKMALFKDVYDYYLILGKKQRLKQVRKSSLIPQPSSNTHETYERTIIREVLRVLSLIYSFFNDKTTFGPISTRFKGTNKSYCDVQGIDTTISTHFQSKIVKNSNIFKPGFCLFARFSGFISHSVQVRGLNG